MKEVQLDLINLLIDLVNSKPYKKSLLFEEEKVFRLILTTYQSFYVVALSGVDYNDKLLFYEDKKEALNSFYQIRRQIAKNK